MIKLSKATRGQIKDFNLKEWQDVNIEHYGHPVEWNEKAFTFKAEEDGKIVGTIRGKHESGVLYIGTLIVAKDARKKGIGKQLMEKAEEFGRSQKAHKCYLLTGKDWSAGKFYESIGYKKEADLPDHNFHKDFVIYSKFF